MRNDLRYSEAPTAGSEIKFQKKGVQSGTNFLFIYFCNVNTPNSPGSRSLLKTVQQAELQDLYLSFSDRNSGSQQFPISGNPISTHDRYSDLKSSCHNCGETGSYYT
jgi:hypothetical protein